MNHNDVHTNFAGWLLTLPSEISTVILEKSVKPQNFFGSMWYLKLTSDEVNRLVSNIAKLYKSGFRTMRNCPTDFLTNYLSRHVDSYKKGVKRKDVLYLFNLKGFFKRQILPKAHLLITSTKFGVFKVASGQDFKEWWIVQGCPDYVLCYTNKKSQGEAVTLSLTQIPNVLIFDNHALMSAGGFNVTLGN